MACANSLIDTLSTENKEVIIYSDSQAVLKALERKDTTSALVRECINTFNSLAERTKVSIAWVPGRQGNGCTEKADELGRMGASIQFYGPEPYLIHITSQKTAAI
ncbi:jg19022 [Pararge aegeria aegeria]|uniref:Jg19022 protein n=1 Tax=Pararge aegeria aegeria TaxID=348720 RepID=A0A8S4QXV8_9NEOP|nr:jg19022 [Pararge aegeria aegeria]